MAAYTAAKALKTFDGLGVSVGGSRHEDVLEAISYVNPLETPFLSSLGTTGCDNDLKEWMVDNIDRAEAVTAISEGEEFDDDSSGGNTRIRLGNLLHIDKEMFSVSGTQRAMDEIGVDDEYDHQAWKAMLILATKFEYAYHWSEFQAGSEGTPRKMQGAMAWAYACSDSGNLPTLPGSHTLTAPYVTTYKANAAPTDLTLDEFNDDILDPFWEKGGDVSQSLCFCGAKVKKLMSKWAMTYQGSGATLTATPLNEREIPAGAKRLVDYTDVFETEFGTLWVNKDRYMNKDADATLDPSGYGGPGEATFKKNTSLLIFEPRFVSIGVLRGMDTIPLAKTGDNSRGAALAELTLVVRNPKILAAGHNLAG